VAVSRKVWDDKIVWLSSVNSVAKRLVFLCVPFASTLLLPAFGRLFLTESRFLFLSKRSALALSAQQPPAETRTLAADHGSDLADSVAGLARHPDVAKLALEQAGAAPAVKRVRTTVIDHLDLIGQLAADVADTRGLGFPYSPHAYRLEDVWSDSIRPFPPPGPDWLPYTDLRMDAPSHEERQMPDEFQMDEVDKLAAQLFVQRLGAWVVTGRQDRIRDTEISAAATNAYQEADAFMKISLERKKR
jgi:hypothetical protein